MVEGVVDEMERRIQAPPGTVFPPLVGIVDEAQVAFMCPAIGRGQAALRRLQGHLPLLHGRPQDPQPGPRGQRDCCGRAPRTPPTRTFPSSSARAPTPAPPSSWAPSRRPAWRSGTRPSTAAPPRTCCARASTRAPLVVASDGIAIPAGQASITVRTHYIDDDDGHRDRRPGQGPARRRHHRCTPSTAGEERDPLADIARRRSAPRRACCTQDVLKRLATLNADAYGGWSFIDLKRVLDGTGAEPYKSDGRHGRRPRPRRPRPRQPRRRRFRFRRRMTGSRPPPGQGGRENSLTPSLTRLPRPDLHK